MKIAHILVCHSVSPDKLMMSIPHEEGHRWHVFFHGTDDALMQHLEGMTRDRGGTFYPYRTNRGLSKSWNEGLQAAQQDECDLMLLLNDDLHFRPGCYGEFVSVAAERQAAIPDTAYVTAIGLESGASPIAGQFLAQHFSCCSITPQALERVGYFDEAFVPAYYEDRDYYRRLELAGMHGYCDPRILLEHERSSTMRTMKQDEVDEFMKRNRDYFLRKWGGDPPVYDTPFNGQAA